MPHKKMKKTKGIISMSPVFSLGDLLERASRDDKYKKLLFLANTNLGGQPTEDMRMAYHWLETNAMETTEEGVVEEVNSCRQFV